MTIRSILLAKKLTGLNFINWYRNLWIVLRYKKKIKFVEQSTRPAPDPETADPDTIKSTIRLSILSKRLHVLCCQEEGQSASSYLLKMKSYLDTLERLGYVMPNELAELHAILKLHKKGISKKAEAPAVLAIREGKIQKDKKKPRGAKGKDKGKTKLAYAPKPKILPPPKRDNPAKDFVCHHCKEGLRESRKLKHGALSMYMGNGMRAAIEAIESFNLILPSGLIIVLDNCEYMSHEFVNHMKSCGIVSQLTPPYTPQHNGVSERRNQTLLDMVRSMMNLTTLPKSFWGYALESAARILNMVPTKKVERMPYEIWHGVGGYPKEMMGYYFYYPLENKIFVARNAEFFENSLMVQEASGSHGLLESSGSDEGLELIQEEDKTTF
ncbi:zinc finger, CCHC-type containing protein [Tanacetum coccineum]